MRRRRRSPSRPRARRAARRVDDAACMSSRSRRRRLHRPKRSRCRCTKPTRWSTRRRRAATGGSRSSPRAGSRRMAGLARRHGRSAVPRGALERSRRRRTAAAQSRCADRLGTRLAHGVRVVGAGRRRAGFGRRSDARATRIVVAWNASREAIRAIRGALPLLQRGRIASSCSKASRSRIRSACATCRSSIFARGWRATASTRNFARSSRRRRSAARALLDAAHAASADLIVMGAWGHSRITELVLGGTTRHLFQSSDLPLLVAH